jgi:hypothetical protein
MVKIMLNALKTEQLLYKNATLPPVSGCHLFSDTNSLIPT